MGLRASLSLAKFRRTGLLRFKPLMKMSGTSLIGRSAGAVTWIVLARHLREQSLFGLRGRRIAQNFYFF